MAGKAAEGTAPGSIIYVCADMDMASVRVKKALDLPNVTMVDYSGFDEALHATDQNDVVIMIDMHPAGATPAREVFMGRLTMWLSKMLYA